MLTLRLVSMVKGSSMVVLRGKPRTRFELTACVGRIEQLSVIEAVRAGHGSERSSRMLRFVFGGGNLDMLDDCGSHLESANHQSLFIQWGSVGLGGPYLQDGRGLEAGLPGRAQGEIEQMAIFNEQLLIDRGSRAPVGMSLPISDCIATTGRVHQCASADSRLFSHGCRSGWHRRLPGSRPLTVRISRYLHASERTGHRWFALTTPSLSLTRGLL